MAKANLPDDAGRSVVGPAAGSDPDRPTLDAGLVQKVAERRAEAERLLAAEQFEAAAPLLARLAKLPHDATRDTALWAKRQLHQLRATTGRSTEARRNETENASTPDTSSDGGALVPIAQRLRSLASAGPTIPILASILGFIVSYFAVSAAMRPPAATLRIMVDAEARGQSLGLGFTGRLHEVDTLPDELRGPPGRQTVSIAQGRVERATLELELADGERRSVKLVWNDGVPELQVPGADGSVLARSIVARQPTPPPEPESLPKPAPKPASSQPSTTAAIRPGGTTGSKATDADPGATATQPPALTWQQERALVIKLIDLKDEGLRLSAWVPSGGSTSSTVPLARIENIPRESPRSYVANLARTERSAESLMLLRELPRLQTVELQGEEWSPRDLEPLRGHSAIQSFTLQPRGSTFSNLRPFPFGPVLADWRSLQVITIECATLADDDIARLKELRHLTRLNLAADALTPLGLAHLADISSLRQMRLRWMDAERGGATDAYLQAMRHSGLITLELENGPSLSGAAFSEGKFPALNNLILNDCPAIDDGAFERIIKSFPWLTSLTLNRPAFGSRERTMASAVTDKGLADLKSLRNLRTLNILSAEGVTDVGLARIAECSQISQLDLSGCSVTDNGVAALVPLKLLNLSLSRARVGDRACAELARIPTLFQIQLDSTDVTDEGLLALKDLKNLRNLSVRQTAVTADAVKMLRDVKPMLNVSFGP